MVRSGDEFKLQIMKGINALLLTLPFAMGWILYYAERTAAPYYAKGNYLIIALFMVFYITYGHVYDGFMVSLCKVSELVYSQSLAALVSDGIMYFITWLLTKNFP